jgi:hypothetical protein
MRRIMRISKKEAIFLVVLAAIYLMCSVRNIKAPGLSEEEAFLVSPAAHYVEKDISIVYRPLGLFHSNAILMTNAWVGPITPLLHLPSLYLFGVSVEAI